MNQLTMTQIDPDISDNDVSPDPDSKVHAPDLGTPSVITGSPSKLPIDSTNSSNKPQLSLSAGFEAGNDGTSALTATKRGGDDDLEDGSHKRVKALHDPPIKPISIHSSNDLHSSILATPTSATPQMTARSDNTNSPMDDLITTPSQLYHFAVPAVPVEAIGALQQASADMLQALVRKDAVDREKQLMVAVGTMRTCLDIHFLPHMEAWKEDSMDNKRSLRAPIVTRNRKQLQVTTSGPPRQ